MRQAHKSRCQLDHECHYRHHLFPRHLDSFYFLQIKSHTAAAVLPAMQAKLRPITSTEVRDQIKALVRAFRKGDTSWDTPWAADQLFTRNAISLVMKF